MISNMLLDLACQSIVADQCNCILYRLIDSLYCMNYPVRAAQK